jgi:hypothetical protein
MQTVISRNGPGGELIEYRKETTEWGFRLHCRTLDSKGNPFDDQWYKMENDDVARLARISDVLEVLGC